MTIKYIDGNFTQDGVVMTNQAAVRTIRQTRKLNTQDFGALLGVSGRTIEKYEQESISPSRSVIMLLHRLL